MASKYNSFLLFIASIICCVLLISVNGDSSSIIKSPAPTIPGNSNSRPSVTVKHNPLKCECETTAGDLAICANNGVTYANQCKFDCAQQKVKRLRKVKDGPCKAVTKEEFWKKP